MCEKMSEDSSLDKGIFSDNEIVSNDYKQEYTADKEIKKEGCVEENDDIFYNVRVSNNYNATLLLIKQHLLLFVPSIVADENTLIINNVQIVIDDEITLIYKSNYVNDLLSCVIIRLIEGIITRESVKTCKISKKNAIVTVLKNYYKVCEMEESIEVMDCYDNRVIISEKGIKGTACLVDEIKEIIKIIINIL